MVFHPPTTFERVKEKGGRKGKGREGKNGTWERRRENGRDERKGDRTEREREWESRGWGHSRRKDYVSFFSI